MEINKMYAVVFTQPGGTQRLDYISDTAIDQKTKAILSQLALQQKGQDVKEAIEVSDIVIESLKAVVESLKPTEDTTYQIYDTEAVPEKFKVPRAKTNAIQHIDALVQRKIQEPYSWPEDYQGKKGSFGVDVVDFLKYIPTMGEDDTMPYVCDKDMHTVVFLTKQQIKAISSAIMKRNTEIELKAVKLKKEIQILNSLAEIERYVYVL